MIPKTEGLGTNLDVAVSQWYVYPHTHITSDMCIPGRDTQNTGARPQVRSVKHHRLGQASHEVCH